MVAFPVYNAVDEGPITPNAVKSPVCFEYNEVAACEAYEIPHAFKYCRQGTVPPMLPMVWLGNRFCSACKFWMKKGLIYVKGFLRRKNCASVPCS